MTAKEQVRVLNQNRMGGLRSNSPPDSDYVFMQPNSVPVLKCVTAELQKISQKSPKEGVYMNPRSLQPGAEGMQSSLYKMVDMSELHTSPEMPETVTEIVTPSETRRADFKSALRRMSSNPKTEENPVISKRNQKIIFPFSKTSNMHKVGRKLTLLNQFVFSPGQIKDRSTSWHFKLNGVRYYSCSIALSHLVRGQVHGGDFCLGEETDQKCNGCFVQIVECL